MTSLMLAHLGNLTSVIRNVQQKDNILRLGEIRPRNINVLNLSRYIRAFRNCQINLCLQQVWHSAFSKTVDTSLVPINQNIYKSPTGR
ncbi:hypothetical protein N7537_005823 [Penicillium hordei]|uniref:Uncharacterized protein n=1 Tax=Penicillium hordei TaxID=40994 RepID=A0AAD6E690_9EURO|nr:uncharacterized protein N7537_005823 [Penicillium hordei]KAJ5602867.1 hypothetical protein N7537_005823 [Penicillium hordei]